MISRKQKGVRGSGATRGLVATAIGAGLLLFAAIGIGVSFGIGALVGIWREQYRVEDRDLDVVITTGKMVHPDVITLRFGLTNGANLALPAPPTTPLAAALGPAAMAVLPSPPANKTFVHSPFIPSADSSFTLTSASPLSPSSAGAAGTANGSKLSPSLGGDYNAFT